MSLREMIVVALPALVGLVASAFTVGLMKRRRSQRRGKSSAGR
jgi:hypothetical protein